MLVTKENFIEFKVGDYLELGQNIYKVTAVEQMDIKTYLLSVINITTKNSSTIEYSFDLRNCEISIPSKEKLDTIKQDLVNRKIKQLEKRFKTRSKKKKTLDEILSY